jgi:hypothetical protein
MNPDIIERMRAYGGSFARALAEAYLVADPGNRAKLEQAFADLFARYEVSE